MCGVSYCSSSGQKLQAMHSSGPGKTRRRAAFGERKLLTPSVTTAEDFTAGLGVLGTFFP